MERLGGLADGAGFLAPGTSEAVVIWREGDIWLRCMVDRLPDDPRRPAYDVKCTELSAAPGAWERRLLSDYAFQSEFYRRGIRAVRGVDPGPLHGLSSPSSTPPYGVSIQATAPSLAAVAEAEVETAIQAWRECMQTGVWPSYPPHTAWVEAPAWRLSAHADRVERISFAREERERESLHDFVMRDAPNPIYAG